jgi:hypothetical protein
LTPTSATETDDELKLAPVIAVGAMASAACGAAWALLIALSRREIGFAAVGVGFAVGHAVRHAAAGRRGPRLQRVAAGCAALGLLLGKYFYVAHMVREIAARSPNVSRDGIPSWFDPRVGLFFVKLLPGLTGLYDSLWLFLALLAAWQVPRTRSASAGTTP